MHQPSGRQRAGDEGAGGDQSFTVAAGDATDVRTSSSGDPTVHTSKPPAPVAGRSPAARPLTPASPGGRMPGSDDPGARGNDVRARPSVRRSWPPSCRRAVLPLTTTVSTGRGGRRGVPPVHHEADVRPVGADGEVRARLRPGPARGDHGRVGPVPARRRRRQPAGRRLGARNLAAGPAAVLRRRRHAGPGGRGEGRRDDAARPGHQPGPGAGDRRLRARDPLGRGQRARRRGERDRRLPAGALRPGGPHRLRSRRRSATTRWSRSCRPRTRTGASSTPGATPTAST